MAELMKARRRAATARARSRRRTRTDGYVLIDVLLALAVAAIALVAVFGGIAQAARTAALQHERIIHLVEIENGRTASIGQPFTVE